MSGIAGCLAGSRDEAASPQAPNRSDRVTEMVSSRRNQVDACLEKAPGGWVSGDVALEDVAHGAADGDQPLVTAGERS